MNIAIDISPIKSGNFLQHRVRGTGFYLEHLRSSLEKYFPEHSYYYFARGEELPNDIDMLHIPYFEPFFLTLPRKNKYKTVVTVHDLTPLVFPDKFPPGLKGKIKWKLQQLRLKKADAIIADSKCSKKDIIKIANINEEKISVVYLAAGEEFNNENIQKEKETKLREKYHLPKKFLLYVGDVTWNKNLLHLIEAALHAQIPLVMVGKALTEKNYDEKNIWNQDLHRVQKLIEGKENIYRLGFVPTEDLANLYKIATAFCMPSLYEGFGLPVLEAMASGCPVITTKEGSIGEIAEDAVYFVDANNTENIVSGLKNVFDNANLRKELSKKGLAQSKKFSWRKTASDTINVYEKAVI